jgi:hypothetical protein
LAEQSSNSNLELINRDSEKLTKSQLTSFVVYFGDCFV